MASLAEVVDVVIGVDTHKHTHTAAVVAAGTGGQLAELTVDTDLDGYTSLRRSSSSPTPTAVCGRGRSKAPAAMALDLPGCCVSEASG